MEPTPSFTGEATVKLILFKWLLKHQYNVLTLCSDSFHTHLSPQKYLIYSIMVDFSNKDNSFLAFYVNLAFRWEVNCDSSAVFRVQGDSPYQTILCWQMRKLRLRQPYFQSYTMNESMAGRQENNDPSLCHRLFTAPLVPYLENFYSVSLLRYGKELWQRALIWGHFLQCLNIIVHFIDMCCDSIRFE